MKSLLTVLSVLFIIGCGSDVKEEAPKGEDMPKEKSE